MPYIHMMDWFPFMGFGTVLWAFMGFTGLDTLDRYTVSDTVSDLARFWTPHCCREQRVGKNHNIGNFRREICLRRVDPRDLPADEGRS